MLLLRFCLARCPMPLVFGVGLEDVGDLVNGTSPLALFCPVVDAAVVSGDVVGDLVEDFGGVLV